MTSTWTRRQFLGTSATTAGFVLSGAARHALAADAGKLPGGFLLGIQSYTLRSFSLDDALKHIQTLGFGGIEFFPGHFPVNSSDQQIADVQKKCQHAGLTMLAHGVNHFSKDHAANERIFEFCKKAGIRNISADPDEDSFDSLDKLVKQYDLRIAIHNHGPGHRYDKVADVLAAIKGHDERIGACADLGHYIRSAEDPAKVIDLLKGRLFGIHLKDFASQTKDAQGVILGKGHLDVEGVFRALRRAGFPSDGALSLEYEENAANPLDDVRQCVAVAAAGAAKAAA